MNPNEKVINYIADAISLWQKYEKNKLIIGLDGTSCAGKSTIAKELARRNENLLLVHLDDFMLPKRQRVRHLLNKDDKLNVYTQHWHDIEQVINLLSLFKNGKHKNTANAYGQSYKKSYNTNKSVLLVEGFFLHANQVASFCDKTIFLSLDKKYVVERRKRIVPVKNNRDQTNQQLIFNIFDETWDKYLKKYKPDKKASACIEIYLKK